MGGREGEGETGREMGERERDYVEDVMLLALKMGSSQRRWVASGSWKRQRNGLFPISSRGNGALRPHDFSPVRILSDF